MNVSAGTQFHGFGNDVGQMNDGGFQRIPLGAAWGVAIIARNLAIHCRETNPERFYLAGILHDIGRLIILENLPDQASEIITRQSKTGGLVWEIEREVLGFDHGEVGAAQYWMENCKMSC